MNDSQEPLIRQLIEQGVQIAVPSSVQIDADVDPARIAAGVVIHPGCRIRGAKTAIGPGCELGRETPLTLEDCVLGADVQLDGGFCAGSVFLDGSSVGSGAHVRPGCLLEEQASGAHTVGFKQTLLMSFVTAGSLINFCDALMGNIFLLLISIRS
jgi:UDP-N-acetylglucosamine/UDP-N-acetylgalactosamine diphosphorylase